MTCDHAEPGKEAKCPDSLGTPLGYMESRGVFMLHKTSEYDLCCFYQVGLSGDFPKFPTSMSLPPMTTCTAFWRMLGSALSQTCLWCTHMTWSQLFVCSENSMPKPAFNALRWRLMLRPVTGQRGSCHSAYFVNTQAVTTCPTSTISSAHITMQGLGVGSA